MFRVLLIASISLVSATLGVAQDRSVLFFPLASDTPPASVSPAEFGRAPNMGLSTSVNASWANYIRLWAAHYQSPSDGAIRNYLGLGQFEASSVAIKRARAPVNFPTWPVGVYQSLDTPHFHILSRADDRFTRQVALDAERFYWAWTQIFYPLWEGSASVDRALAILDQGESVMDRAGKLAPLKSSRTRMKIVVFANANEYQSALIRDEPGVGQSTGYYSDKLHTMFVYGDIASDSLDDAAATRFHELTHQLFREATFSSLRGKSPGESKDFWLVEGIAGYMESFVVLDTSNSPEMLATVGGWDSERLQYARYRILVSGDSLPLSELRSEGRVAVQRRSDLARWYAHAIAQTHRLIDGDAPRSKQWLFNRLAELYRISSAVAPVDLGTDKDVIESDQTHLKDFLIVDDEHLQANSRISPPRKLCLATCEVTGKGLGAIPPSNHLSWLDLSRTKDFTIADVERFCTDPASLRSLSFEATGIDSSLAAAFLAKTTNLDELDLSSTPIDNSLVTAIDKMRELKTLWLTGSLVGDPVIDAVTSLEKLQTIDVQRTKVTESAIEKLRAARPDVRINPLEIR